MAWRRQATHNEESKAVKEALTAAGINARVGHGRGTAWGWLEINIGNGPFQHNHETQGDAGTYCREDCPNSKWKRETREKVVKIAQEVTGRHGDYSGEINVMTQDHWDAKLNKSVPIPQNAIPGPGTVEYETLKAKVLALEKERGIVPKAAPKPSARLRVLADGLTKHIDDKSRPMTQNPTPKRMREYRSRLHDAHNLERTQKALIALADLHDSATIPPILADLRTKDEIRELVYKGTISAGYYDVIEDSEYRNKSEKARLLQSMIDGVEPSHDREAREKAHKIAQLEADVQFRNLLGFFPTPEALAKRVIEEAGISEGDKVLEPEAGKGDLAQAARQSGGMVDVCEYSLTLQEILKLKGFNLVGSDFLELTPNASYDRIVMNPPFENGKDAEHIRHAFKFLAPGGRLVAIASEGLFFRSDRKSSEFRQWIEDINASAEKIESGAFSGKDAFRQTGIACRLVIAEASPSVYWCQQCGEASSTVQPDHVCRSTVEEQQELFSLTP